MSKVDSKFVRKCLKPFPKSIRDIALGIRTFIWDEYPQANELIYDNYNAVAVGWSVTERQGHTFCSFAVSRRKNHNVHFGFYWGAELADPQNLLIGNGNQYRYILVKDLESLPVVYLRKLMREAYKNSLARVKDKNEIVAGKTIFKSESATKRS
jgi:hypothetical protein